MNVIYAVLQQIQADKWYGVSKNIEIAKGKNKLKTFKEKREAIKRVFLYFFKKTK
jgi:hypothetical protein